MSRSVFHGSVISDILDGSHYAKQLLNIGILITDILGVPGSDEVWKPVKDIVEAQEKKAESLRGVAKSIFESGKVDESNAKDIKDAYSTSYEYL